MRLIPKEEKFYEMFCQMGELLIEGATLLAALLADMDNSRMRAEAIKTVEHKADSLTHEIITKLNQTFVTPFDREDIHALSSVLDDVLDLIDATAMKIVLYKIRVAPAGTSELCRILDAQVREIAAALGHLQKGDGIMKHCAEINRLEDDADRVARASIGLLFEREKDPIELIKSKELYEGLELATDKCEDVANIVESIVVKAA